LAKVKEKVFSKMEKLLFEFKIKNLGDQKTNVLAITSISTKDGRIYKMPEEYQPVANHKNLQETETFKKVKHMLKKRRPKKIMDNFNRGFKDGLPRRRRQPTI